MSSLQLETIMKPPRVLILPFRPGRGGQGDQGDQDEMPVTEVTTPPRQRKQMGETALLTPPPTTPRRKRAIETMSALTFGNGKLEAQGFEPGLQFAAEIPELSFPDFMPIIDMGYDGTFEISDGKSEAKEKQSPARATGPAVQEASINRQKLARQEMKQHLEHIWRDKDSCLYMASVDGPFVEHFARRFPKKLAHKDVMDHMKTCMSFEEHKKLRRAVSRLKTPKAGETAAKTAPAETQTSIAPIKAEVNSDDDMDIMTSEAAGTDYDELISPGKDEPINTDQDEIIKTEQDGPTAAAHEDPSEDVHNELKAAEPGPREVTPEESFVAVKTEEDEDESTEDKRRSSADIPLETTEQDSGAEPNLNSAVNSADQDQDNMDNPKASAEPNMNSADLGQDNMDNLKASAIVAHAHTTNEDSSAEEDLFDHSSDPDYVESEGSIGGSSEAMQDA